MVFRDGCMDIRFAKPSNTGKVLVLVFALLWAPFALPQGFTIQDNQTCLDAGCHGDLASKAILHKPAAKATTCKFCHKATEPSRHEFSLAAKKTELCSRCHKVVTDQATQHMPAKRGMCTTCHDPHQSDNRKLLKKRPAGALCKTCHRKIGEEGKTKHAPVENEQCTACHDPHASEQKALLKAELSEVCLNCHKRALVSSDGDRLPATSTALENESLVAHKPVKTGRCNFCHQPHSSDNHRLLKKPYPAGFYSSFAKENYFCFGCHKATAFEEPRTLTATEFRNGNLNLHYRHVNREKGRTCRACHDHHAGTYPKLIREAVPFGERFIKITEFTLSETGGTCAPSCHMPVAYDRLDPVPIGLKMSPREGEDATKAELEAAYENRPK